MPGTHDLTPAGRAKLAAILGRLGSEFDGERAAAGLMADRLVREAGLTWPDVLAAPPPATPPPPIEDWRACAAWCADRPELLNPWEQSFLSGLAARHKPLTPRQANILQRLLGRRMAAGGGR